MARMVQGFAFRVVGSRSSVHAVLCAAVFSQAIHYRRWIALWPRRCSLKDEHLMATWNVALRAVGRVQGVAKVIPDLIMTSRD